MQAAISGFHRGAGITPIGHYLSDQLGDKGGEQPRTVPEWIESGRVILTHTFDTNGRGHFVIIAVQIRLFMAQCAGVA